MKLGFIGIGAMGAPMALRLLEAGYDLSIYDVLSEAVEKLAAKGAKPCPSPLAVAQEAETLFMSLPNEKIVETTLSSLLGGKVSVSTVIDLSSISPAAARGFAELLKPAGVEYLDCPVSGGVGGAQKGTLTIMAGGDKDALAAVTPVLNVIGKKICHVGGVGSGSAIKLVNNYMLACNMATTAEALALGEKLGLDIASMREIVNTSSGRSFITENKVPGFIEKRDFTPGFTVNLQFKDLGIAQEAARVESMPLMMGGAAAQIYQMARARGYGGEDISSVIKICEEWIGSEKK